MKITQKLSSHAWAGKWSLRCKYSQINVSFLPATRVLMREAQQTPRVVLHEHCSHLVVFHLTVCFGDKEAAALHNPKENYATWKLGTFFIQMPVSFCIFERSLIHWNGVIYINILHPLSAEFFRVIIAFWKCSSLHITHPCRSILKYRLCISVPRIRY